MVKKVLSMLLCLCLIGVMPPVGAAAGEQESTKKPVLSACEAPEPEEQEGGIAYSPYWKSYTARMPQSNMLYSSPLPKTYDLRSLGLSTTVKDQDPWGSCWAFGCLAALESNVLINQSSVGGQEAAVPDYSELQLAWFTYDKQTADSLKGSAAGENQVGEGMYLPGETRLNAGGHVLRAVASLASWQFAANESAIPYQSQMGDLSDKSDWSVDDSLRGLSEVKLKNADVLPDTIVYSEYDNSGVPVEGAEFTYDESAEALVKRAIMTNGAVNIGYYADQSQPNTDGDGTYFNYKKWCQYVDVSNSLTRANHSVAIVGWDDTYPKENFNVGKQPDADGAWIVKNSWGTDGWGIGGTGYFYLSYYDRSIRNITSLQACAESEYDNNYQYDYLQLASANRLECQQSEIAVGNVFTANGPERLDAVSVVTEEPGTTVELLIIRLNENAQTPFDGETVYEATEQITYAGYHTIDLGPETPIYLSKNDKFAVWMVISDTKGNYYLPVEISGDDNLTEAKCNAGESFMLDRTLGLFDIYNLVVDDGALKAGNVMIKAFTTDVDWEAPELQSFTYKAYDRGDKLLEEKTIEGVSEPGLAKIPLPGATSCLELTGIKLAGEAPVVQATVTVRGQEYTLGNKIQRKDLIADELGNGPVVITVHSNPQGLDSKTYEFDFAPGYTVLESGAVTVTDSNGYIPFDTALTSTEMGAQDPAYAKIQSGLVKYRGADKFYVLNISLDPAVMLKELEYLNLAVTQKEGYSKEGNTVLYFADVSGDSAVLSEVTRSSGGTSVLRADVNKLGYYVVAELTNDAPVVTPDPVVPSDPIVTAGPGGTYRLSGSTVTIIPDEGYEISEVTVNGERVAVPQNGVLTGIESGDVVDITFGPVWSNPFADVKSGAWYYEAVRYAYENKLFYGTTDTAFSPGGEMTREMLATVLWRAAGEPEVSVFAGFTDVKKGSYYEKAVNWAKMNGIVNGISDKVFGVGRAVSREDIATMLWRWEGQPDSGASLSGFTDSVSISSYALPAMRWAVEKKLIQGRGNGVLSPKGNATRAEVASIFNRYLEK